MNNTIPEGENPKFLIKQAESAAARGDEQGALVLFETCIRHYLSRHIPFKALAVAKNAKTVLGPLPQIGSLLIRLYVSMGLQGDAEEEYNRYCRHLRKETVPFLAGLHREAFTDLLGIIRVLSLKKGCDIVKQHDQGEDMFIILSGTFAVIRDGITESTLESGCVFGELGFFHHVNRSATVKATSQASLIRIPSEKLHMLARRYSCIQKALETVYAERTLKKAHEDLRIHPLLDVYKDNLSNVFFSKGQTISFDAPADIIIVKHGIVEIDYDDKGPARKRFFKPGSIIEHFSGTARANTDVELVLGSIDLLGSNQPQGD